MRTGKAHRLEGLEAWKERHLMATKRNIAVVLGAIAAVSLFLAWLGLRRGMSRA
jgi:hypothetical protein